MTTNRLTDARLRAIKPAEAIFKIADGEGLYLQVQPNGARLWRLAYRFAGKQCTLGCGQYPTVGLAEARGQRDWARQLLREGRDPSAVRKAEKAEQQRDIDTFAAVAKRWFEARKAAWVEGYAERVWARVEDDLISVFGDRPIRDIVEDDVLAALRKIEARGAVEMARRVRNYAEDIFSFAKAEGLITANPACDIVDALKTPPPPKRRTPIKRRDLPEFLAALDRYDGEEVVSDALRFTLLTMVRTTETRFAMREEFEDLDGPAPLWRIPPERMKMRREHLVPLAPQAVEIVRRRLRKTNSAFLFPGSTPPGVMSSNTMIYAIYRLGFHSRATVHGFRGTASTILNEATRTDHKGQAFRLFHPDWIERQLAHDEENAVRAAYNSAEHLPERRRIMCWWADFIDDQAEVAELVG